MSKLRSILYINHYHGGDELGMEFRSHFLADHLNNRTYSVSVLTSSFSHVRMNNFRRSILPWRVEKRGDSAYETNIIFGNSYKYNDIFRLLNITLFVVLSCIWLCYTKIVKRRIYDIVICSSTHPFDIYIARFGKFLFGSKIIFELHDLWPESLVQLHGMHAKHPFVKLVEQANDCMHKSADAVISILPNAHENIYEKGFDRSKPLIIAQNFIPPNLIINPQMRKQELHDSKKLIIGYAGSLGEANKIMDIIHCVKKLDEIVELRIYGQGPLLEKIKQIEFEAPNIRYMGSLPRSEIHAEIMAWDLAYNGLSDHPLFDFGIAPNKLIDYMMCGSPVLLNMSNEQNPVAFAKCGFMVGGNDMAEIIKSIHKMGKEDLREMGRRGQSYASEHHNFKSVAEKIICLIDSIE